MITPIPTTTTTVGKTIEQLHKALSDYIEATYHIGDERLIHQRKRLLDEIGVIHQEPYLESTPRYRAAKKFADIRGLDKAVVDLFGALATKKEGQSLLVHDPPYEHQATSVSEALVNENSLVVMTGTGSGKTECFLLPILGKLAIEARHKPTVFKEQSAVRSMVLYPMNALVNDQLGRLRLLFGDERIQRWFMGQQAGQPGLLATRAERCIPGFEIQRRIRPG
jgi:ATP-dependent helicase YprA (DUF1998 family)